jgi:hypothetical protein
MWTPATRKNYSRNGLRYQSDVTDEEWRFTLSGAQAVMVSDLHLCGDQCLKGITCSNHGGSSFNI